MQPDRLPPLSLFRCFEAAARLRSFKLAAAELHVTPAAVSQQMKALEGQLGTPLFQRLTRQVRLTAAGEALLPKVQEAFAHLGEGVRLAMAEALPTATPATRRLTVIAPPAFAGQWLVPRLPGFHALHPEVALRLVSRADAIDQTGAAAALSALMDASPAETQLAVLYGSGRYPGFQVDALFAPALTPVCTPAWLRAHPLPAPAALVGAALIHDETLTGAGSGGLAGGWVPWLQAAGVAAHAPLHGPHCSNSTLAIDAALAGLGVALAVQPMVATQLAAGRLVSPFPGITVRSPYTYALVAPQGPLPPAAEAFRGWVRAQVDRVG